MVKALVIRKVFETIVNKLPHRPVDDNDCRELFKKIVSKMQKGDIRKEILSNLEQYFDIFEELIVSKTTSNDITDSTVTTDENDQQQALVSTTADSMEPESTFEVDMSKLVVLVKNRYVKKNGGSGKSDSQLNSVLLSFIEGRLSVQELLSELVHESHAVALKSLWDGEKKCSTSNSVSSSVEAVGSPSASIMEGVVTALAFVDARSFGDDTSHCSLLALCFLLVPEKRQNLVALLLTRYNDEQTRTCAAICFAGHVAFWCEHLLTAGQAQQHWFTDAGSSNSSNASCSNHINKDFGADVLLTVLKMAVAPVVTSSKYRASSNNSNNSSNSNLKGPLERLEQSCSSSFSCGAGASLLTSLTLLGMHCSRFSNSSSSGSDVTAAAAVACGAVASNLLDRELMTGGGVSVWEQVHAQLSQVSSNMDTDVLLAGMAKEREQEEGNSSSNNSNSNTRSSRAAALMAWACADELITGAFVLFYTQSLISANADSRATAGGDATDLTEDMNAEEPGAPVDPDAPASKTDRDVDTEAALDSAMEAIGDRRKQRQHQHHREDEDEDEDVSSKDSEANAVIKTPTSTAVGSPTTKKKKARKESVLDSYVDSSEPEQEEQENDDDDDDEEEEEELEEEEAAHVPVPVPVRTPSRRGRKSRADSESSAAEQEQEEKMERQDEEPKKVETAAAPALPTPSKRRTRANSDLTIVAAQEREKQEETAVAPLTAVAVASASISNGRRTRSGSESSVESNIPVPVKRSTRAKAAAVTAVAPTLPTVAEEEVLAAAVVAPTKRKTRSNSDLEDSVKVTRQTAAAAAAEKKQRWR